MTQNERWQWQKVTDGRFFCESSIIEYLCKRNMNEKEIKKDMATISEGIQYETLLCEIPKNPNSVWTIDMEPLSGVTEVR